MDAVIIEAGAAVIGDTVRRDVAVHVANGVIRGIAGAGNYRDPSARVIDAHHLTLIPGLIDVHIHGGFGRSFQGDSEDIGQLARDLPRWGVTTVLPTLGAVPRAELASAVGRLVRYMRTAERGCRFAGIHLEGPYFNPKRKGAQHAEAIRLPDVAEVRALLDAARGQIRLMTIAPEMPGAADVLRVLDAAGVMASVGHSEATLDTLVAGMPDGSYDQGHRVVLVSNGRATLADGTLAGSCTPLIRGVKTMVEDCGVPLATAVQMATANPARSAGCSQRTGTIAVGKDADLVLIDEAFEPRLTMVRGAVEFEAVPNIVTKGDART